VLSETQLQALATHLQAAIAESSRALTQWLGRPAEIGLERLAQVTMVQAATLLGNDEQPVVGCWMKTQGWLTGYLILICDDESGFALADVLLGRPVGTSTSWGPIERSAVQETANVVGCAFLNHLAGPAAPGGAAGALLPTPPLLQRDFAAALVQFAVVPQASVADLVLLMETKIDLEGLPTRWHLLFVPDADGVRAIQERPW
jgi:chemotaxis protein CheC